MTLRAWLCLVGVPLCVAVACGIIAVVYSTRLAAWIGLGWIGLGATLWAIAMLWLWRERVAAERRARMPIPPAKVVRS